MSGSNTANSLMGGVDEVFQRTDSSGARSFLRDALGSTLGLADQTGTVQTTYSFDAFGNTTAGGSASSNTFAYTGREIDAGNLYYYRARYYNPQLQRFISEDPLGFGGGINSYAYAGNNPEIFKDPTGLDYNVNYDANTNTLIVNATVGIYGPDANGQLANAWQQSANNYWNAGGWKHGSCNVRFNFTFKFLPDFHQAWHTGPQNLVFVEHDTMPFDILGVTYNNYGYWSQGMLPWDVAHEMGHLLLLGDDYPKLMPQGLFNALYGNHDGHIMSNNPVSVAQHEVDQVLAGRGCGCK
jgi:RHS repeat-associated protein